MGDSAIAMQLDAGLGSLMFDFPMSNFSEVTEILRAKYGKPTKSVTHPWQSVGGASTSQVSDEWNIGDLFILAQGPGRRIDRGRLSIMTGEYLKAYGEDSREKQREKAKDL